MTTKETLMQLADALAAVVADDTAAGYCLAGDSSYLADRIPPARQALSDAIDTALKQARVDALIEAIGKCSPYGKTGECIAVGIKVLAEKQA